MWIVYLNLFCHKVTEVGDGDGFKVRLRLFPQVWMTFEQKIRLFGCDAPETKGNQPYGAEAKEFLRKLVEGKPVSINHVANSHDRWVCKTYLYGFIDVAAVMVLFGHAHNYKEYGNAYWFHEWIARGGWSFGLIKQGLWNQKNVILPSVWRDSPWLWSKDKVVKLPTKKKKRMKQK